MSGGAQLGILAEIDWGSNCDAEFKVLLACCRAQSHDAAPQMPALSINWEHLLDLAELHGVTALVWNRLGRQPWRNSVPTDAATAFTSISAETTRKNLFLSLKLTQLLELLRADGVVALPFKGPALASRLYGELSFRSSSDLDLLIRETDFEAADSALTRGGLRPSCRLTARQRSFLLKNESELVYFGGHGLHVDLHWNLQQRYYNVPLDPGGFWERKVKTVFAGAPLDELSPEDLLLCLALHARKHYWSRLIWICDVAQLLVLTPGLDWEQLLARARKLRALRTLLLTLLVAHRLLAAPLPEAVCSAISADDSLPELAEAVIAALQAGVDSSEAGFQTYFSFLKVHERRRDRCIQLLRHAFTPGTAEWNESSLPAVLYLPMHLLRMGRKALRFMTRMVDRRLT